MKHIFLIANNPRIKRNIFRYLNKIRRQRDYRGSLIVGFNHMDHLSRIQPNIVIVRGNKWQSYMGMRRDTRKHIKAYRIKTRPKYIFVNYPGSFQIFRRYNPGSIMIKEKKIIKKYKKKKIPTTGFIAIYYFLKRYPRYKIHLIGFTFKKKWRGHSYRYERNMVSKLLKEHKNLDIIGNLKQLKNVIHK